MLFRSPHHPHLHLLHLRDRHGGEIGDDGVEIGPHLLAAHALPRLEAVLQYCLQYDKENLFKPMEKDKIFGLRKDVAQGRLDLQKYFDDNYNYLPNAMNTFRFAHCMIIYRLEEYQAEVERIVKKYCKECE